LSPSQLPCLPPCLLNLGPPRYFLSPPGPEPQICCRFFFFSIWRVFLSGKSAGRQLHLCDISPRVIICKSVAPSFADPFETSPLIGQRHNGHFCWRFVRGAPPFLVHISPFSPLQFSPRPWTKPDHRFCQTLMFSPLNTSFPSFCLHPGDVVHPGLLAGRPLTFGRSSTAFLLKFTLDSSCPPTPLAFFFNPYLSFVRTQSPHTSPSFSPYWPLGMRPITAIPTPLPTSFAAL